MQRTFDTIVVGAGPAGSTASRLLAERGARVVLLDRAGFPRDKPCGGGVTVQAACELGVDISAVVEREVDSVEVSFRTGSRFRRTSSEPLSFMTQRSKLDAHLVEIATSRGVTFRDQCSVSEVRLVEGGVTVRADNDVLIARTLVAADGANGIVSRSLGLEADRKHWSVAIEGNLSLTGPELERWGTTVALDLGRVERGYGWLFPKGDHVNVGVGGSLGVGRELRRHLVELCSTLGLDHSKLRGLRGHQVPVRRGSSTLVAGPVLFVGDAAALVDPLSYEGIAAAAQSARLASNEIVSYLSAEKGDLSGYQIAIERELMPDIRVAHSLQAILTRWPRPCVEVLRRSDRFWARLCGVVRGETTYTKTEARLGLFRPLFNGLAKACAIGIRR